MDDFPKKLELLLKEYEGPKDERLDEKKGTETKH